MAINSEIKYRPKTLAEFVFPNEEVKEVRFSSTYVPWQEVCLIGVKTLSDSASSTPLATSTTITASSTDQTTIQKNTTSTTTTQKTSTSTTQ